MPETRKVLGQSVPASGQLTAIYTVPALTQAVVSTVSACNRSTAWPTKIRLSVAVAGAADEAKQYVAYDVELAAKETRAFTIGITLGAADVLRAYSDNGEVSFNAFGVEIA